jgi:RimJ/RimL family protein N-acetyltransferase
VKSKGVLFDFKKEYVLENDRALIRPLLEEDINYLLPFSENEPELWRYSLVPVTDKESLISYISIALHEKEEKTAYPFIIYDKKKKAYAGSTRFYDIQLEHKTTLLGYTWYGKAFQGTGLNKKCKLLLLEFAFEEMGLERVEFRADNLNIRSIAALKSIGCKEEGVLRSNCISPDGRRDSIVLSILKDEWLGNVKENLKKKISREKNLLKK